MTVSLRLSEEESMLIKNYAKLDKPTATLILGRIRKNLQDTDNPSLYGKALAANSGVQWRYRVGDYRLLVQIEADIVKILILNVGYKREIYEN